ncbi:exonuclease domain-containing protein [Streptomyces rubradiris]|uniref:3'-5' exonuclease n=1 Tax=Streptomyces rubradiris TaxID=285531 RepID=UPI0036EFAE71
MQIAVAARDGTTLFDELVDPQDAVIEPDAIKVHGITPDKVRGAMTFSALLPRLADVLHGRTAVTYGALDHEVFERELARHFAD